MHLRWLAGVHFDQEIHHVVLEDWSAIGLGFVITPLFTVTVGRDFDLRATGVLGGTAAYVIGRI